MRVQIPAYTDRWMMGDRYGEVVKFGYMSIDKVHTSIRPRHDDGYGEVEIAHVKLDISGKTVRVILADCTPV